MPFLVGSVDNDNDERLFLYMNKYAMPAISFFMISVIDIAGLIV